jgi:cupin 2 domain-containing protein
MVNIFEQIPASTAPGTKHSWGVTDEQFSELFSKPGLKIERIVSTGQSSPPDFWYDQAVGEWVLLIQGEAKLRLADEPAARHLKTGDFLNIPAHQKHRVDWTPADQITIWLAIHHA